MDGSAFVYFSEPLKVPSNLERIEKEGFEFNLIPASEDRDKNDLNFTWAIEGFHEKYMKVRFNFDYPLRISTLGSEQLDQMTVTIKNNTELMLFADRSSNETLIAFMDNSTSKSFVLPQLKGNPDERRQFVYAVETVKDA